MDPENCYICNETSVFYSRNLFKTKSKYTETRICEFIRKFLGDYPSERDCVSVNDSENEHCVCMECLSKIDEYDLSIMTAKRVERELRDVLLHTEALFLKKSTETEALFIHSIEPIDTFDEGNDECSEGNDDASDELKFDSDGINAESDSDEDYVPHKMKRLSIKKPKQEQLTQSKKVQSNHRCLKCNMEFKRYLLRHRMPILVSIRNIFSIAMLSHFLMGFLSHFLMKFSFDSSIAALARHKHNKSDSSSKAEQVPSIYSCTSCSEVFCTKAQYDVRQNQAH